MRQLSPGQRPFCMSDSLAIYLHDHLAGSKFAVELLEFLRSQHAGQPLGDAAATLSAEVAEDRKVLQGIIGRVGNSVRASGALSDADPRLCGVDFNQLAARAEQQHSRAEELRLQWVRAAFARVPVNRSGLCG